jgi:hypothetical protein
MEGSVWKRNLLSIFTWPLANCVEFGVEIDEQSVFDPVNNLANNITAIEGAKVHKVGIAQQLGESRHFGLYGNLFVIEIWML